MPTLMHRPRTRTAHVTAPSRMDLAGGFTEILPALPGAVLSASLIIDERPISIRAKIVDHTAPRIAVHINGEPDFDLAFRVALDWLNRKAVREHFALSIECHLPCGSGLGTSSQ